ALTKSTTNTVTLSGANSYSGGSTVSAGTLALGANNVLADSGAVAVDGATAVFSLGTNSDTVGVVTLKNGGSITGTTGVLTASAYNVESGSISAILNGSGALTKSTTNSVTLTRTNAYTGLTTVNAGVLTLQSAAALGATNNGTVVNSGGAVEFSGGLVVVGESLTLSGAGPAGNGALRSVSGTNRWEGNLVISADATVGADTHPLTLGSGTTFLNTINLTGGTLTTVGNGNVTVNSSISGSGGFTKNGTGTLSFTGTANSYVGDTTVNDGTLSLNVTVGNLALGGNLIIGDDIGAANSAVVQLQNSNFIPTTANVTIASDGRLDLNNRDNQFNNLTVGGGNAITGTGTLTVAGDVTGNASATTATITGKLALANVSIFNIAEGTAATDMQVSAVISGAGGVDKGDLGLLEFTGINTYTGGTTVDAGTLKMSERRALGTGDLTINGGAELQANWHDSANNAAVTSLTIDDGTIRRIDASGSPTKFTGTVLLTTTGNAFLTDAGGDGAGGYLQFGGPINIDSGTLTLNAASSADEVRLDSSAAQDITLAAGATLATTGAGTKLIGSTSARNFIGQGITGSDSTLSLGSNTTFNSSSTLTINGAGLGGLTVAGSAAVVDALLTTARVQGLSGTDGTLTIAYANENSTNTFSKAPSSASNLRLGFDVTGGTTNTVYSLGAAANDLANWNGLVVKGGRVELAKDETLTGTGTSTLDITGGTFVLAGGSPLTARTLTIAGQATLSGGQLDGGLAASHGKLIVSGDVESDGTTLTHSPDITMNISAGTNFINGSTPLTGLGTLTKTGAGTVQVDQQIGGSTVVINQGTLLLGAAQRINGQANLNLAGGTLDTGGLSDTIGTLTLSATSTLEMGNGASILHFGKSSSATWTGGVLNIVDWTGSGPGGGGGGTDQIYFGTDASGLTSGELSLIRFVDPNGLTGTYAATMLSSGEIVPVPEPATIVSVIFLIGWVGCRERARIRRWLPRLAPPGLHDAHAVGS
ncbi:MAG: autotransporter-associated beta strand repeat-containing protein, partial [Verrucomicrobia bacterium]|nr:autotransporter-associated beta strand repeat-containing protein [Verrucomicrobiota bacterium]